MVHRTYLSGIILLKNIGIIIRQPNSSPTLENDIISQASYAHATLLTAHNYTIYREWLKL